jgi:hypothetical protein
VSRLPEEVAENAAFKTPEARALSHFVAKQLAKGTGEVIGSVELADAIGEIEEETQILGSDFLKVHVIDPGWRLQNSGFIRIGKSGLLEPEVEIEWPSDSERFWISCAVEGSTEVLEANFVIIFQDKIFNDLRSHWGPRYATPGTTTRAQFIYQLLVEAGIKSFIPGLNVVQPVEEETKGEEGQRIIEAQDETKNKSQGVAAGGPISIKGAKPTPQQLKDINTALAVAQKLKAPVAAVEALIYAGIAESSFNRSDSNASGHNGIWQSDIIPGNEVAKQAEFFLKGGESFQGGGAIKLAREGKRPIEIAETVEAGGSYAGEEGSASFLPEAQAIIQSAGGIAASSSTEASSDIGQLKRGIDGNPDEDSGECIKRLAQQVDWFAFSNGRRFFYMNGPELARQTPELRVDIPGNKITRPNGRVEAGVILNPSSYLFDQTSFQYQQTHKVRKKSQRRSRTVRPTAPSEIKLHLLCDIRSSPLAGDCFIFENSGLASDIGRWLVVQTTRKCFRNAYTEIICEPPPEPLPEPKESTREEASEEAGGNGSASEQAVKAYSEKGKYVYSEGTNRTNNGTLFGPAPRTMDCSSFVTLCYKDAGLPDPSGGDYSTIGNTESLIANCEKVTGTPSKDDLCFYEGSESAKHPQHVTLYIGGGKAIGMESPGVNLLEGTPEALGPAKFLGYYRPKNY